MCLVYRIVFWTYIAAISWLNATQINFDGSFGSNQNGTITFLVNPVQTTANSILLETGQNIVIGGFTTNNTGTNLALLAEFTPAGIINPSFGTGGITTTAIGTNTEIFDLDLQNNLSSPSTAPYIVAAGQAYISNVSNLFVARYTPGGILDTSFGSSGFATYTSGNGSTGNSLAVQASDQKIVSAGATILNGIPHAIIARFTASGSLDGTFGSGGIVDIFTGQRSSILDVKIQADGKIVGVGFAADSSTNIEKFLVVRLNSDGSFDNTFGSGGIMVTSVPNSTKDNANSLGFQSSDGKIIVAGNSLINGTINCATITRYNTDGSTDTSYSTSGFFTAPLANSTFSTNIAIQTDNKAVAVGLADTQATIARFTTSGFLDSTFGNGGGIESGISDSTFNAVAIQSDGKIVCTGTVINSALIERFMPNNSNFVAIQSPINGSTVTSTPVVISGTSSQTDCLVTIAIDSTTVGTTSTDSNGNWSFAYSQLSNGSHTITATLTCESSPSINVSDSITITRSTTDTITITSPATGETISTNTPTIIGTSTESNKSVLISIDGTPVGSTTTDSQGSWQFTLSTPLSNGSHTFSAELIFGTSPSTTNTVTVTSFVLANDFAFSYHTGSDVILLANTFQSIIFNNPLVINNDWSFNNSNGQFTCPHTGIYEVAFGLTANATSLTTASVTAQLLLNGSIVSGGGMHVDVDANAQSLPIASRTLINYQANQPLLVQWTASSTNVCLDNAGSGSPSLIASAQITIKRVQ